MRSITNLCHDPGNPEEWCGLVLGKQCFPNGVDGKGLAFTREEAKSACSGNP